MIKLKFIPSLLFIIALTGSPAAASDDDRLIIKEIKDTYVLTVPVSRLAMILPKSHFGRYQSAKNTNPRYFMFTDQENAILLSGWFESSELYSGAKQIFENDVRAWKKNDLPDPRNVVFSKYDKWEIVSYEMNNESANNCHIRAHWVQDNTWIDVHISMTSDMKKEEIRKRLESILKGITIIIK